MILKKISIMLGICVFGVSFSEACIVLPQPISGTSLCATATQIGTCSENGYGVLDEITTDGVVEVDGKEYSIVKTADKIKPMLQPNDPVLGVREVLSYSLTVVDLEENKVLKITKMVDLNAPAVRALEVEPMPEANEAGLEFGKSYQQKTCVIEEVE